MQNNAKNKMCTKMKKWKINPAHLYCTLVVGCSEGNAQTPIFTTMLASVLDSCCFTIFHHSIKMETKQAEFEEKIWLESGLRGGFAPPPCALQSWCAAHGARGMITTLVKVKKRNEVEALETKPNGSFRILSNLWLYI